MSQLSQLVEAIWRQHPWLGACFCAVAIAVIVLLTGVKATRVWKLASLENLEKNAAAFALLLAILGLLAVTFVPVWQTSGADQSVSGGPTGIFSQENEARRTVVQICGGLFAVFGILLAVMRVRHTARDVDINGSQERTGRYIKCVELLGSIRDRTKDEKEPSLETRLGAIYALRALAKDSPPDRTMIVKTLAGYVQMHVRRLPVGLGADSEPAPAGWVNDELRIDVKAALSTVAELGTETAVSEPGVNLGETYLDKVALQKKCRLGSAGLSKARLRSAILEQVDFTKADLYGSDLHGATLAGAILDGAVFKGSDLSQASLGC